MLLCIYYVSILIINKQGDRSLLVEKFEQPPFRLYALSSCGDQTTDSFINILFVQIILLVSLVFLNLSIAV